MADNLTLKVTLRGDGRHLSGTLRDASGEVREFGSTSDRSGRQSSAAFERTGRSVRGVNRDVADLNRISDLARNSLLALGGAFSVREVINYSDAWTNASNQIRQVTDSSAELEATQRQLMAVANESRTGFESTANLYSRLARSTTEMGLSQRELLRVTETINKSFAVSGATAEEASAAIVQLSQGLAAGALRGDEFNSVSEQAPGIMRAISRSLNMGIGDLKAFAASGGITAEIVVKALQDASDEIDGDFGRSVESFGQKMTRARNSMLEWIGASDEVNTAVGAAGDSIVYLAGHMDEIVKVGQIAASLYAGRLAGSLATYTTGVIAANSASLTLTGTLRALRGVMATAFGPLGIVVAAAGVLYTFRDELDKLPKPAREAKQAVEELTAAIDDSSRATLQNGIAAYQAKLVELETQAQSVRAEIERVNNENDVPGPFRNSLIMGEGAEERSQYLRQLQEIGEERDRHKKSIEELEQKLSQLGETTKRTTKPITALGDSQTDAAKAARKQAEALQALQDKLDPVAASQRDFLADQITLQTAWASGKLTLDQYLTAVAKLPTLYQNAGDAAQVYELNGSKAAKTVNREMTYLETAITRSVERLDDTFVDFWENVISGSKNTFDALKQVAISTLAEIAHAYTTRQITASLGLSLAGTGSAAAGGTGAGGMGGFGGGGMDLTSLGKTIYQGITDGFGAINWTGAPTGATAYTSGFGAQAATGGGMFGGSLQNFSGFNGLASLGAGYVGSQLGTRVGSSLFGKQANSNWGATIGGGIGTFFGGPVGAFAGSALGGVVDSLFGSSRKYTAGFESFAETPDRDFGAGGTPYYSSGYYRDGDLGRGRETPFGSFGFTDKTKFEPSDMIDMLDAMAALDQTLASAANETQIESVKNALDGWQTRLKNDSLGELVARRYAVVSETLEKDASEATAKLIERVGEITADSAERTIPQLAQALQLGNLIDGLSGNVQDYAARVVDDTNTSLEDAFSQITAGVSAHAAVSAIADELNLTFDDMGDRAVEAALNLQQLAGGLDALQSQAQTYYANFFSAEEQRQRAIDQISPTLEAAGLSAESTRAQFRAVVESLDLNTESGRQTYSELMSVAGAFAQLSESAADAAKRTEEIEQQRWSLQNDLLRAQGNSEAALARERQRQLDQMPETLRALQQEIWAIDERNKAAEASAQQQMLLQRTTLYSNGTVGAVDGLIDRYQRAMEVAQTAADERQRQLENEKRALATIGDMLDAMRLSDQSILNPAERLAESRRQFAALQVRAEAGDTDALSQLGQAKNTYLTAAGDYYGQASAPYAAIYTEVESALSGLEDQYGESLEAQGSLENVQRQVLEEQRQARNTLLSSLEQQVQQSTQLESIADLVSLLPPSLADSLSAIFPEYATDVGSSFDAAAYLTNKTAEVNAKRQGGRDDWTPGEVYDRIIQDYGSLEAHYQQIGRDEGVSPTYQSGEDTVSQQTQRFDEGTYVANQVAYLNDRDRGDRTWSDLQFYMALDDANLSAYEHWLRYGRAERVAAYAQGGAFTNGIVQEPTYFDTGLMGEAGPEAIMPLTRTADGSLGVRSLPPLPAPVIDTGATTNIDLGPVVAELKALRQDNLELRARLDALVETSSDTAVHTRATAAHSKRTAENVAEGNRHSRTRQRMPV